MRTSAMQRVPVVLGLCLVGVLAGFLHGCGGGGGSGSRDIWVQRFSAPNFAGILLDEAVTLVFSTGVDEASLNHDSVRFRTGPLGGDAPRGTFFKGVFLIDPDTGSRVVVDPDQLGGSGSALIQQIEAEGLVSLVPLSARYDYDPTNKSPFNGNRQVLFNKSDKVDNLVTFAPEIPTRTDMSDTGYASASTYTVVVPTFPQLNTVFSEDGDPLLPREGRMFVSTFTTVPVTFPVAFLGGENEWNPYVVNTEPANGTGGHGSSTRIYIRFSQAIDPRTVTPINFVLENVSTAARPQIPVSLFLRQTRMGTSEVIMTPLQDLDVAQPGAPAYTFEVTVTSGVRDLLSKPLTKHVMSFNTGGETPPLVDILETFSTNAREETLVTTANWNGRFDYVGAEAGALVASFAPFAGSGADSALAPNPGDALDLPTGTTTPIVYNFTGIEIPIGVSVTANGSFGLVWRCQGDVYVGGEISVNGGQGGTGGVGSSVVDPPSGGPGGAAGPGGFGGGNGGVWDHGEDTAYLDGVDGFGPGGGKRGRYGDQEADGGDPNNRLLEAVQREGGGGGVYAPSSASDAELNRRKPSLTPNDGGLSGTEYAAIVPPIVGTATSGFGGSGGGGGGGEDDAGTSGALGNGISDGFDDGGGGGGGGGGAFQLVAYGDVEIDGIITANGGGGGNTENPDTGTIANGAPGGGGSGGAIWIQSNGILDVDSAARIEALGGSGGVGDGNGTKTTGFTGGNGGPGYIFLQDADGSVPGLSSTNVDPYDSRNVGEFEPPTTLDSAAGSSWFNQRISTPNYGEPTIDYILGPLTDSNRIVVEVQGSREDVNTPEAGPVDPDTDPGRQFTTDWITILDTDVSASVLAGVINQLDNFQYLRFRVFFEVDPLHDFADPLPKITEILIPVSGTPD